MENVCDMSQLPDVVWVNVMTRLSLGDRARLSVVCRRLNDIFNHPSVWYRVDVKLIGSLPTVVQSRHRVSGVVVVPERYLIMIERFGDYFQDVRLTVRGDVCNLQESCRDVLEHLARCRLESLTLKIGEGTTQRKTPSPAAADAMLALIRDARRLRRLDIRTWPLNDKSEECDVINCLCANDKIRGLEKLSLFCREPSEDSWVPLQSCLPEPNAVVELVKRFTFLTSLSLHSALLTNRLLDTLSKPRPGPSLLKLGIMVVYGREAAFKERIPRIDDKIWSKVRDANPGLAVEWTFCNTMPSYEFVSLLNAEIPTSSVAFMKYVRYRSDLLTCLGANYSRTLTAFFDYSDEQYDDVELVSLVEKCSNLRTLVSRRSVGPGTVERLAVTRGRNWKIFQVAVNWTPSEDQHGDDVLCRQPGSDQYVIAAHLPGFFYHSDVSDEQKANAQKALYDNVSSILGYKWQPVS